MLNVEIKIGDKRFPLNKMTITQLRNLIECCEVKIQHLEAENLYRSKAEDAKAMELADVYVFHTKPPEGVPFDVHVKTFGFFLSML